jgi:FtsZ-interacting cell division protein YlmF
MQSALALNSYEVGRGELQGIRLSESIRYSPDDYEAAIREISDAYRRNRVIAVDVRKMDQRSAIRLMDFCSGLSAGSMGWIFRLSDNVLVLTPGVQ